MPKTIHKKKRGKLVSKKIKLSNFEICWRIITDHDIRTNKSKSELDFLSYFKEYFQEAFNCKDNKEYTKWWEDLAWRTDVSEDDKTEIMICEEDIHLLCNVRDNLVKNGLLK